MPSYRCLNLDCTVQPLSDWLLSDSMDAASIEARWATPSPAKTTQSHPGTPSYCYSGLCPATGALLTLPRTPVAEAIAQCLMQQLAQDPLYHQEGKMYGILIVRSPQSSLQPSSQLSLQLSFPENAQSSRHDAVSISEADHTNPDALNLDAPDINALDLNSSKIDEFYVLKAFSGLLNRQSHHQGWVPPIPGRGQVALAEAQTLTQLDAIKHQILALKSLTERGQYTALQQQHDQERQHLRDRHQQQKRDRHQQRSQLQQSLTGEELQQALQDLNRASQQDGIERRNLKHAQDEAIAPLRQRIQQADQDIRQLKQQRKSLSQQLQAQMHAAYQLTNFAGTSTSLEAITHRPLPTGTGDCCAPKLLHYAATHHLIPIAMAEFWWGSATSHSSDSSSKIPGTFYGACTERCQPIMGFLLSGLSSQSNSAQLTDPPDLPQAPAQFDLPILYQDDWLIAIHKPANLLSVPGRHLATQDSVLTRLQQQFPQTDFTPVHRLDQPTSGILLFAKTPESHRHLSNQFQQRQVDKTYEALLPHPPSLPEGTIDLPLWGDPGDRPRQCVHTTRGKPSVTHYRVIAHPSQLETSDSYTRIEFTPITGRTHQIRVHAASAQGLGTPIVGDRLYGCVLNAPRLYIHARALSVTHPHRHTRLHLKAASPF
ncbi:MAG: pseudouridine synthase [Elainellaceae cyanobacterium]